MKLLEAGAQVDGFRVLECIHAGGMAHIYRVEYAQGAPDPGFPMAMKIPRMTAGDGAENIVSFEVELQILPALTGPHVPRFVAAGDLQRLPYLVMEYIPGQTLEHWLGQSLEPEEIARLGAAMADAAHSLHQQNACHLDLKPGNVLFKTPDHAVLLDFGLSWHAHYPDLLAEELRLAVGSPAWIAPEQVVGVRGDPRSDIFAIGVMLYELATGELPFGAPSTRGGMRQRLWLAPAPPRRHRPDLPPWLQEVILRCLEAEAARRYPSAAHLAFDLRNPEQVPLTERGQQLRRPTCAASCGAGSGPWACTTSPAPCPRARSKRCPSSWWPCRTRT
jgi:Serine/threonine protein kinase